MERIGITHVDVVPHATTDLHPIRCFVIGSRAGQILPIVVEHSVTTGTLIVRKTRRAIDGYRVWICCYAPVGFARVKVEPGQARRRRAVALVGLVLGEHERLTRLQRYLAREADAGKVPRAASSGTARISSLRRGTVTLYDRDA